MFLVKRAIGLLIELARPYPMLMTTAKINSSIIPYITLILLMLLSISLLDNM